MPTATRTPSYEPRHLAGTWHVSPRDSHARFTARTLAGLLSVPGSFRALAGTMSLDGRGASGSLAIEAGSIDTGNRLRDRHLRSSAFFGAAKHAELRYEAFSLEVDGPSVSIDGVLLIAGTRTSLPLAAQLRHDGDDVIEIACRTQLDRLAAGVRGARGIVPRTVDLDVAVLLRRAR
jgi:polyisoprenoid-binding protein YceI